MEARKRIVEKLEKLDEVEDILKVHVDQFESFLDVDKLRWNTVDIFVNSKEDAETWKDKIFRQNIFSKCYLWESYKSKDGEYSRQNLKRQKEKERGFSLRSHGFIL